MGRPRSRNRHLPPRMQFKHGAYYYVRGAWIRLGKDYGEALRKWAELEGSAMVGRTVSDALNGYLIARMPELAAKTLEGYRASQQRLGKPFGTMRLQDLKPQDVARYLAIAEHKVTANRDRALLAAAYQWAIAQGWAEANPAKVRRNPEKPRTRYVTDAELHAILSKAPTKLAAMIELAYMLGIRKGDLLRLKLSDLREDGIHTIHGKTGRQVVYRWTPELRAVVDQAKGIRRKVSSLWLFPSERSPGQPMTARGLHSVWERVRKASGVRDVTWHDLRRKAGSDTDAAHATELLGHSDPKTTRRHYRARPYVMPGNRLKRQDGTSKDAACSDPTVTE